MRLAGARLAAFLAICSVPFVMVLSNSMLIPVLPELQRGLQRGLFHAGLLITAFSIPGGLFIPVGGYVADRFGRKVAMVPGLFLFGLGGLIAGLAPLVLRDPYLAMLAGRVVQGIGAGFAFLVAMALAGDWYSGARLTTAVAVLEAANGIGKVAAPVIGAAAGLLVWFAPFYVYPLLAWPSALAIWLFVREPRDRAGRHQPLREYLRGLAGIWRRHAVSLALIFLAGLLALFLLFGFLSWFSDVLERRFDVRGFTKGYVIAVPVFVMAVTSFFNGTLAQRWQRRYARYFIAGGLALGALGLMNLAWPRGLGGMLLSLSLLGLGDGLLLPALNTLVTSSSGTAQRGMITALYGTVRFLGAALGPPAISLALALGPARVAGAAAVLAAAVAVLGFAFIRADALLRQVEPGDAAASDAAPGVSQEQPAEAGGTAAGRAAASDAAPGRAAGSAAAGGTAPGGAAASGGGGRQERRAEAGSARAHRQAGGAGGAVAGAAGRARRDGAEEVAWRQQPTP